MDTRTSLLTGLAAPMWALEAVMRGATAITHALEESQMFDEICEIIAADERYPLATICWARDNPEHSVDIVAAGGSARQYSQGLKLSWGDNPFGRGPVGAAIRTGEIQILNSALNSPFFQTWSERARGYGFEALISLPLKINGAVEGALSVYSNQVNAFQDAECRVLQVLSESVAFGTLILRERIRSNAMFKNTISALAEALAKRDAYTSGHQKRVTNLAVTIADELGLAKERIRGLHFAGLVHDIGKIQIPSELLTKPSRLTPEEFALMKRHAQAELRDPQGYRVPLAGGGHRPPAP